jgi:hypothetical protein
MVGNPKKSSTKANIAQNRLYITVGGALSKTNLDKLYTDIRFCVADLAPGFDVVNDLSGCSLAALSGLPTFKKILNHLITNKVGTVVRVVDEKKIIFKQILNVASRMQGYSITYVNTLEDAEEELINSQQRDGLRFYLHNQRLEYRTDGKKGVGQIIDISTSGCAVNFATLLPVVDEVISLSAAFNKQTNLLEVFDITARVVWIKNDNFAVKFENMEIDYKNQLWERLVHESKCEVS